MRRWIAFGTVPLLLGLGSCGGDGGGGCGTTEPCPVGSVVVSPGSATIVAGTSATLSAVVKDTRGQTMSGSVSWSSGSPGVATVSAAGVVTGVAAGTTTITGSTGGKSDSADVTVTPNGVPSVTITAPQDGASVVEGTAVALSGSATDPEDGSLAGAALHWASSRDGALGSGGSLQRADLSVGVHTITLTATDSFSQTESASVALTVTASPQADAYEPDDDPANATPIEHAVPQTHDLFPATDEDWLRFTLAEPSYVAMSTRGRSESDDTVLEVFDSALSFLGSFDDRSETDKGSGFYTNCIAPGSYYVRVKSKNGATSFDAYQVGFVLIPCSQASESPGYDIELRFLPGSNPSASLTAVAEAAADRWKQVVAADLTPGLAYMALPEECAPGDTIPPFMDVADDLLLFAEVGQIDGQNSTLAYASPCRLRPDSLLPYFGYIRIDVDDLALIELDPTVLVHEMGHALGLGVLWEPLGLLADKSDPAYGGTPGADTHFTGDNAIAEFDAIGGIAYTGGQKVPVENDSAMDTGSLDVHWRESVLDTELMSSEYDPVFNALSVVTIGSLEDIGYAVDYFAADPYFPAFDLRFELTAEGQPYGDDLRIGTVRTGPVLSPSATPSFEAVRTSEPLLRRR